VAGSQHELPGERIMCAPPQGKNAAKFEQYQLAEVKHGRLAMIGFSGMVHQYFATGQQTFEQLGNFKSIM
jgi:hypothetical protein